MFDIGWSEMAVIALVALVVFGPKELPAALRTGAKLMKQGRKLAREFQGSIDQLIKEAELDEVKNLATAAKQGRLDRAIEKAIDPTGEIKQAVDAKEVQRELSAGGNAQAIPAPVAPPASVTPASQTENGASEPTAPAVSAPAEPAADKAEAAKPDEAREPASETDSSAPTLPTS
jgi:sec-independent protein translocase protein TatB